jgi:phosphoribosylcarboxyaminoimidazole (NCAIR) mutase
MSAGLKILDQFNVPYEVRITSAHRTPELMSEFAEEVSKGGVQVIVAGAGGAAHRKSSSLPHSGPVLPLAS